VKRSAKVGYYVGEPGVDGDTSYGGDR
jgi:hypothetical protein